MVYTEEQVIESLFKSGGTLANEGVEVLPYRKNAKEVYFNYKGKPFCINRHNVILKFSDTENGRYFQFACLEFENSKEENEVKSQLIKFLGR